MKTNKFDQIPKPKNLDLVCVEYDDKLVVGKYLGINKGFIELDNTITLSMNQNANIQHQKGVYPVSDNKVGFRWNGTEYFIPKTGHNMTVSHGAESRNLKGYKEIYIGPKNIGQKLMSTGNKELADVVLNYRK